MEEIHFGANIAASLLDTKVPHDTSNSNIKIHGLAICKGVSEENFNKVHGRICDLVCAYGYLCENPGDDILDFDKMKKFINKALSKSDEFAQVSIDELIVAQVRLAFSAKKYKDPFNKKDFTTEPREVLLYNILYDNSKISETK